VSGQPHDPAALPPGLPMLMRGAISPLTHTPSCPGASLSIRTTLPYYHRIDFDGCVKWYVSRSKFGTRGVPDPSITMSYEFIVLSRILRT